ncbi:hypothetical protein ZWY2020_051038 [Hordeum vulgare]|nr:hypothetical protein ZWY2020_051038 [Hordeum vulgare]
MGTSSHGGLAPLSRLLRTKLISMLPMVTEAWTLAGCGGAAASKPAAAVQEDAVVVVGRRRGITPWLLTALALAGASSSGGAVRAAVLEADDDLELLERVKEDKKKRLQKQGNISSSAAETGYLQDLLYKLSKVVQAIDKDDLSAAGDVLGPGSYASSSSQEKSAVDSFNSSLSSLFTSVSKSNINSSKSAFVSSATALEKWVELVGLTVQWESSDMYKLLLLQVDKEALIPMAAAASREQVFC